MCLQLYHVFIVFSIAVTTIRATRESTSEKICFFLQTFRKHRGLKVLIDKNISIKNSQHVYERKSGETRKQKLGEISKPEEQESFTYVELNIGFFILFTFRSRNKKMSFFSLSIDSFYHHY